MGAVNVLRKKQEKGFPTKMRSTQRNDHDVEEREIENKIKIN